jgi:hypothetical protein
MISKSTHMLRNLGYLIFAAIVLSSCKNNSVLTQWYAFPSEESVTTGHWTLLAGVSEQRAPMMSFGLAYGTLVVISITSPDGVELARREVVFPGVEDVSFIGRWQSSDSFSVDIFDESSAASSVGGRFYASIQIEL